MSANRDNRDLGPLVPEMIALIGGIISAVILVMPLSVMLGFLGVLVAPLVEEICKVCGLFFMALYYPRALSTKKKGVILGGLSGLGFAFTENLFYFIRAEMGMFGMEAVATIPLLRIIPMFGHILWSALVGIGLVSFAQKQFSGKNMTTSSVFSNMQKSYLFPLLTIAIVLHLAYNLSAFQFGLPGVIISFLLIIFIYYSLSNYFQNKLVQVEKVNTLGLLYDSITFKKQHQLSPQKPVPPGDNPVYPDRPAPHKPVNAAKPVLIGLKGYFAGKMITLDTGKVIIGREPRDAQLIYPDNVSEISRKHCMIYYDKHIQQFIIEDMSSNGTYIVPDKRLTKGRSYQMEPGARFYLSDPGELFEVKMMN